MLINARAIKCHSFPSQTRGKMFYKILLQKSNVQNVKIWCDAKNEMGYYIRQSSSHYSIQIMKIKYNKGVRMAKRFILK